MIELIVGLLFCFFLYFLGHFLYPDAHSHSFVPEPHKMLINYGEAVGMVYGREEE
jgi:hypothetical protein